MGFLHVIHEGSNVSKSISSKYANSLDFLSPTSACRNPKIYNETSGASPIKYPYKGSLDIAVALAEAPIAQFKQFGLRIGLKLHGLAISHVICSVPAAKRVI